MTGMSTMVPVKERYVVDEHGNRIAVLLDIEDYRNLLAEIEELESIRAYDAAKASDDRVVPFEQAVAEIEREHR
jgi:PHD/YefM family antitoxin component YafN of YafNO toxin-antitoxin module